MTKSILLKSQLAKLSKFAFKKWQFVLPLLLVTLPSWSATLNSASSVEQLKNIYGIVHDKHGYIWMAGQRGLIRHDGKSLIHYSTSSSQWHIPYTWINTLSLSEDGSLIISTEDGSINLFNTDTGKNRRIPIDIAPSSIYHHLLIGSDIYFYMPGANQLYRHNITTRKTTLLSTQYSVQGFNTTKLGIYFYTRTGVFKIEDQLISQIYEGRVRSIASDNKYLYVATQSGLTKFDDDRIVKAKTTTKYIKHLITSNNKERLFLLHEDNSISYLDKNLQTLDSPYKPHRYKGVRRIFHDNSNVLWLYGNQGVYKLSPNHIRDNSKYFDVHINAIGLAKLGNEIIISSYGAGLQPFNEDSAFAEAFESANKEVSDATKLILDVFSDDNTVYMATFDGIWHYNLIENKYQKLDFDGNNQVFLRVKKQNNKLILGTDSDGILIYDLKNNLITNKLDGKSQLSSPEVLDILILNNAFWIATANGLDVYYPGSNNVKTIVQTGGNKITSLQYLNGKIYALTKGSGVYVLNAEGQTLSHIANGIDFNDSTIIDNKILGSSLSGLFWIDPKDESYAVIEGTQEYGFTSPALLQENTVYVGHYGGVITFPLNSEGRFDSPIKIARTTVSGKTWIDNIPIAVNSSSDVVTLELASLDFREGLKKRFQYKINDGLWQKINGDQLTLTGLASGDYDIVIQGTNSFAQWSNHQAFVKINVAYPWYWTPQIRIIYAVLLVCLIAFISWLLYLRGKSISHIHQLLSSEIKIKGRTASKVSKQLEQALELIQDIRTRESNELNKALLDSSVSIVSEAIEELKDESTGKEPDNLYGKTLDVAVPYLSSFLKTKYRANLVPQISVDIEEIPYELQADIYKIIYEALMSAILNGSGRNFKLTLQMFKEKLWLTIHDDTKSLANFNDRINFDMAMYYIRQIGNKHNASINAFEEADESSQLIVSFPTLK